MTTKVLKLTVAALLVLLFSAVPAMAQDFGSLLSSAATANQRFVNQTDAALQATDLATLKAQAAAAVATGQQVVSLLNQALAAAPDDASRSRAQGVLTHVSAAVQAGQMVATATSLDEARGRVQQMRGEAQEALNEVGPPAAAPAALPSAGEPPVGALAFGSLALAGFLFTFAGLALRRRYA